MENILSNIYDSGVSPQLQKAAKELFELDKKSTVLSHIEGLIGWDRETYMPHDALESRAEQMSCMHQLIHTYNTDPRIAELLHILGVHEESTTGDTSLPRSFQLFLRKKYRQWKKAVSVPPALVAEMARESTIAHGAWVQAREQSSFKTFAPHLKKLVDLTKNYAMCIGYEDALYDAILDEYEPSYTIQKLNSLFSSLQEKLTPLYLSISEKHAQRPALSPRAVSSNLQRTFCTAMAKHMGYDFSFGRIDESAHPFCSTMGWKDVRITTRYLEHDPTSAIFSTLHEMGHAFYEYNIDPVYKYTCCCTGSSFGIHESQSRFLENVIGRSHAFWKYWYPKLQTHMPAFADESFQQFIQRIHSVRKNPIRVESDEVGYNLHIILRFEVEKLFFEDENAVESAEAIWNEKSNTILGIYPRNAQEGILQDVHWSEGAFGYFPSYALGNIYAAQLHTEITQELPEYEQHCEQGDVSPILTWLTQRIHRHGAGIAPTELFSHCDVPPVIQYLQKKYNTE